MKSALVVDCDVNPQTLPEYLRKSLKWRMVGRTLTPYLPQGTVFEGIEVIVTFQDSGGATITMPQPAFLVTTGQAAPGDEECAIASGMTPEQAKREQRRYLAAVAGIQGKNDLDLFMAEVIDGYDTQNPNHSDKTPVYVWGRNAEAYREMLGQKKNASDDDE